MIVFDGKMGMRKFGSAAPPFGKVACVVKAWDQTLKKKTKYGYYTKTLKIND